MRSFRFLTFVAALLSAYAVQPAFAMQEPEIAIRLSIDPDDVAGGPPGSRAYVSVWDADDVSADQKVVSASFDGIPLAPSRHGSLELTLGKLPARRSHHLVAITLANGASRTFSLRPQPVSPREFTHPGRFDVDADFTISYRRAFKADRRLRGVMQFGQFGYQYPIDFAVGSDGRASASIPAGELKGINAKSVKLLLQSDVFATYSRSARFPRVWTMTAHFSAIELDVVGAEGR